MSVLTDMIDQGLLDISERSIAPTSEVADMLLDIRQMVLVHEDIYNSANLVNPPTNEEETDDRNTMGSTGPDDS